MIKVNRIDGPYLSQYVKISSGWCAPILSWHIQKYSDFTTSARLLTRGFIEDPMEIKMKRRVVAYLMRDVKYKTALERMELWRRVDSFYEGR